MTIPEIFARHGEPYFRDRENRVLGRLIGGGPRVVATGGGAFIHSATRDVIKAEALSGLDQGRFRRIDAPASASGPIGRSYGRPIPKEH